MRIKVALLAMLIASALTGCGTPNALKSSNGFGIVARPASVQGSNQYVAPDDGATSPEVNAATEPTNPKATFKGCWFKQGKNRYQGVDISVGNAGTYAFNAYLYYGTTCNSNDVADQIGMGEKLGFGGFGYTFWFDRFANQKDMSALWYVGNNKSVCVNYETAPDC